MLKRRVVESNTKINKMKEKQKSKLIEHHANRLSNETLMDTDKAISFIRDVIDNFIELQNIPTPIEYCKCIYPKPNYPEMVWCNICGKQIK